MNYDAVYGWVKATTEAAILLVVDEVEYWIPRSLIDEGEKLTVGDAEEEIYVADWFLRQEGLL